MKNYLKVILGIGVIALIDYLCSMKTDYRMNALMLQNIEALAIDEFPMNTNCAGKGSLDCPIDHNKVKYVSQGYSLGH